MNPFPYIHIIRDYAWVLCGYPRIFECNIPELHWGCYLLPYEQVRKHNEMLELNAEAFLGAATQLARLHQIFTSLPERNERLLPESAELILVAVESFKTEADRVGARLSVVAASRFMVKLGKVPCPLVVDDAIHSLNDIESRFADFLSEIKLLTLTVHEAPFMESSDVLLNSPGFSIAFPSASFEIEEAAKCVALGRHTAAVFHAMRMLEIGIKALAKRLSIPDPTKPAEKNWAIILKSIREKIDNTWPASSRMPKSEGVAFEELYANLDAVRNPWRNATMHVETIYAQHESLHIIRCSAFFMTKLATLTDEEGSPPPDLPSLALTTP